MSKILANEIANFGDDSPIDLKEGLNIPVGKPLQAAGSSGTSGQVLSTTGSTVEWVTPFSGSYTDLSNRPTIPAAQVNADWNATNGIAVILNKPVVPPSNSVVTETAGTASLSFNAANGQFTYTPPDLSSFATTTSLTTAVANSSNWDTAFGWGDHASAGYLTAETDTVSTVFGRSVSAQEWHSSTGVDAVQYTGKLITGSHIIGNDVYFFGLGDNIHIHGEAGGITYLDRDSVDDNLPYMRGSDVNKKVSADYFIRMSGLTSNPSSQFKFGNSHTVDSVMHHDVFANSAGNPVTYSIGNDNGIIRLGNVLSTTAYLEASSTATKLFHNGSEVLTTTATGVDLGSNNLVTTGKLLYSNNYANLGDLPSATTYHGMFAHVHAQGHGYFAHGGAWTQLLDEGSSINDLADVDLSVAPTDGQVLKWDNSSSSWKAAPDLTGGGGGGLALTDLSVSQQTASGDGSLSYNNASGVFSYTPPDLSNFLTSIGDAIQDADFTSNGLMKRTAAGTYTSVSDNSSNWDTAFGWGDHSTEGYLTALPTHGIANHSDVTITSPQDNQLLKYNNSLAQWENFTSDFATETWVQGLGEITKGNSKVQVTGSGTSDGSLIVLLQDANASTPGEGKEALKVDTTTSADLNGYANTLKLFQGNLEKQAFLDLWYTGNVSNSFAQINAHRSSDGEVATIRLSAGSAIDFYTKSGSPQFKVRNNQTIVDNGELFVRGNLFVYDSVNEPQYYTIQMDQVTGNVNTIGSVTADSFVKDGGTSSQYLMADGSVTTGGGNTQVSISDTIPAGSASAGDLWWESDTGRLKIYYQDTDSAQWVDVNPPLRQDRIASTGAPSSATDTGVAGDIRYDSNYVYIAVGTNTWKRAALTTW